MLARQEICFCCVHKAKWKGISAQNFLVKDTLLILQILLEW